MNLWLCITIVPVAYNTARIFTRSFTGQFDPVNSDDCFLRRLIYCPEGQKGRCKMKWLNGYKIRLALVGFVIATLLTQPAIGSDSEGVRPIADAGSSRYAAQDPVMLDGTGSYDPDNSCPLSYEWRQIGGPSVVIIDANTATPTIGGSMQPSSGRDPTLNISGFTQTDEIQECEFELLVSDGKLTSLPDTVKVIIVPDFGAMELELKNDSFDPNKPTIFFFGGGNCVTGLQQYARLFFDRADWLPKVNAIEFLKGYKPDDITSTLTYYQCGDMIIVYLSSVAPNYNQPIQTSGHSTGGMPAIDVGIRLNLTYVDARYAVNRVTFLDATGYCRDRDNYSESITAFLGSSVDGEQCWIDSYPATLPGTYGGAIMKRDYGFQSNVLTVWFDAATGPGSENYKHYLPPYFYANSLRYPDLQEFNHGIIAGAYWSVIGPGKNLQLASTPDVETYKFTWYGDASSGYMDFYDEGIYPGRLPEPVTLVGPEDGALVDANGAVLSCEESENAVGYQLLFGLDPDRVMYYYTISDTPSPPTEVITTFPFKETWWTVKVRDQYGSTIYADPIQVIAENVAPLVLKIENVTLGKGYSSIQTAIDDAVPGDEIVAKEGIYYESIDLKGKNLLVRSTDPNDPTIVAATVINGVYHDSAVIFSGSEDASCVLAGFTINGGKRGIYCSGASPTITNCTIAENVNADMGAGMFLKDSSSPTLVNCMFSSNSASVMGGGMYNENSSPILINCTFAGNSATYFGGGIYSAVGSPVLTNCILWGDTPDEISMFSGTPVITYSDVQGGWAGEGNIDADPLFADPGNGDYHLKSQAGRWDLNSQSWVIDDVTSPCIDAGDPSSPVGLEPLPNGGIINMGAYGGKSKASKSP